MAIVEAAGQEGFITRVREIASTESRWHRRLWRGGTLQIARELLEESVTAGVVDSAIDDLRAYAVHALRTDPGIGSLREVLGRAAGAIKPGITIGSYAYVQLEEHLRRMDQAYLSNWADEFDKGKPIDVEGAAWRIAAHILDSGYDRSSLHPWIGAIQRNADQTTVADFLRGASERLAKPDRAFTFCVPVITEPPFDITPEKTPGWLTAADTVEWKKQHAPAAESIRHQGAFLLEVRAKEINSAADRARARIADLEAKFLVGGRHPIRVAARMWSKDKGKIFAAQATNRSLDVRSFERLEQLSDLQMPDYITSAVALIQPVRTGAAHQAIMSGWSAIESLLIGPDDRPDVIAAERFSLIVSASIPRAELTRLSNNYSITHSDALAQDLKECPDNLSRAKLFQRHLCSGTPVTMAEDVDNLAIKRLTPYLSAPGAEVRKVAGILTKEFVRFYRKRNLIVHGGRTHADSLHPISETMSPLIGAGVDRIIHVGLKFGVRPIALAAVVAANLDYLVPATAADPGNLLDIMEFPQQR